MIWLRNGWLIGLLLCVAGQVNAMWFPPLSKDEVEKAAGMYLQYCSLCHGDDRQGYANDEAPSLRSESLIGPGFPMQIMFSIAYGRRGTPMASFLDEVGGPLSQDDVLLLTRWLQEQSGYEPFDLPLDPIEGDVELGKSIYQRECVECHGENGEGGIGTALGNQTMLALTSDAFLRWTIEYGREETVMPAFGEVLESAEIDAVTAFLRSQAGGWTLEKPVYRTPPTPEEYVLNPTGKDPDFKLKDNRYVLSEDLHAALQDNRKIMLLDTRVTSMWQMAHIEGAVSIPYYYENFDLLVPDLPKNDTWIVSYCECPRAAAERVDDNLRALGYKNTAVLWEGIQGWIALGFPVSMGQVEAVEQIKLEN